MTCVVISRMIRTTKTTRISSPSLTCPPSHLSPSHGKRARHHPNVRKEIPICRFIQVSWTSARMPPIVYSTDKNPHTHSLTDSFSLLYSHLTLIDSSSLYTYNIVLRTVCSTIYPPHSLLLTIISPLVSPTLTLTFILICLCTNHSRTLSIAHLNL